MISDCCKKIKKLFLLGIFVVAFFSFGFAQNVNPMELGRISQYVTDYSNVLSSSQLGELNALAENYDKQTTNQLVTIMFPDRSGNQLIDIGMKFFRENQIGQKGKNNGLLLLIATNEKKIRIVVGYGLEGIMPDVKASQIIEENIRGNVNSGDFYQAVRNFYDKSIETIGTGVFETVVASQENKSKQTDPGVVLFIIGFVVGGIIRFFLKSSDLWFFQKGANKAFGLIGGALLLVGLVGRRIGFASFALAFVGGSILGLLLGLNIIFFLGSFGGGGGGGGGFGGGGGSSGGGGAGD